jgi:hypothetical protein
MRKKCPAAVLQSMCKEAGHCFADITAHCHVERLLLLLLLSPSGAPFQCTQGDLQYMWQPDSSSSSSNTGGYDHHHSSIKGHLKPSHAKLTSHCLLMAALRGWHCY